MDNKYVDNKNKIKLALKELWNYMRLNQLLEKSDLIIGCGCQNLEIPIKCAKLFKEGYGRKILFSGGVGKITKACFAKSEAEIYKEIAIKEGINENDILIETKSTNTGDNFRFSTNILNENNIVANKIIIVHGPFSERRTLSSAQAILKGKKIMITSPDMSFDEFLDYLEQDKERAAEIISVIVGDIQRLIIYPQFGWQVENKVPKSVEDAYQFLKNLGFKKYILSVSKIRNLIEKYGLAEGQTENYFN